MIKRQGTNKIFRIITAVIIAAVLTLTLTGCLEIASDILGSYTQDNLPTGEKNLNAVVSSDYIHKNAREATATLQIIADETITQGSCFFISPDGVFVTNHHVIIDLIDNKANETSVQLYNGRTYSDIELISYNADKDIAVLKLKNARCLSYLRLKKNGYRTNDKVFVLGTPLGKSDVFVQGKIVHPIITVGSAKCIQMTAELKNGNSGGPLLSESGAVIGINSFSLIDYKDAETFYAVAISEIINIYPEAEIYSNGDGEIDTPICGEEGHSFTDGKNHGYTSCLTEGHFICDNLNHKRAACGTGGHYNCDGTGHAQSECGHYMCDGREHGIAGCGLIWHCISVQDGLIHSTPGCGDTQHCTADGRSHAPAYCGLEGHFECDYRGHFFCIWQR